MGRNFAKLTCWSPNGEIVLEHQVPREGGPLGHYQLTHPEGRVRTHGLRPPLPSGSVLGAYGRGGSLRDLDEWLGLSPPHLELFPVFGARGGAGRGC